MALVAITHITKIFESKPSSQRPEAPFINMDQL